jgi:hypothetical protein
MWTFDAFLAVFHVNGVDFEEPTVLFYSNSIWMKNEKVKIGIMFCHLKT